LVSVSAWNVSGSRDWDGEMLLDEWSASFSTPFSDSNKKGLILEVKKYRLIILILVFVCARKL
jgi:hypothetical protein